MQIHPQLGPIGYHEGYTKIPDSAGMGLEQLRERIGGYDSSELDKLNPEYGPDMPTQCRSPLAILGFTKDRHVAFIGSNYISSMPLNNMKHLIETGNSNDPIIKQLRDGLRTIESRV